MGKFSDLLNRKLAIVTKDYRRPVYNSFMSGPEWRNVEIAEEFAAFLKEGHSLFHYPYFRQILDIWKVFFHSYSAARKYDSHINILTSEYMVMDVFVTFFTMMELLPKGILSLLLWPLMSTENNTVMQGKLAKYFNQYAGDLQTIPFYDQPYAKNRAELASAYRNAENTTWTDWISWKLVSAELFARHWVSIPLHAWFHAEENNVQPTTDVLVKWDMENETDPARAKYAFGIKIKDLRIVEEHIYTEVHNEPAHAITVYALLRVSRYAAFIEQLQALTEEDIQIIKIAAQDQVQVKCEVKTQASTHEDEIEKLKKALPKVEFRYSYGDRISANRRLCLFDVPVTELQKTVRVINSHERAKVTYVHNF